MRVTQTPARASAVLVFTLLSVAHIGTLSAQTAVAWMAAGPLTASNAGEDDHFGAGNALTGVALQVSRDGRTLAVAAPHEDSAASGINGNQKDDSAFDAGAVYMFTQTGSGWAHQAYLKASNAQSGDQFGFAVALSGDGNTLAVGANFEDSGAAGINGNQADESANGAGAVYVFVRSGATWTQQAYIKASNAGEGDRFGYSLALSDEGNTLSVGTIGEDSGSTGTSGNQADNSAQQAGAVYVFTRSGATWTQQAYLKASNTQAGDMFGFCVALSADGNTLGVCAYDEDSSAEGIDGDQADNSTNGSGAA
jgi:trimeric autotransporter adhesin